MELANLRTEPPRSHRLAVMHVTSLGGLWWFAGVLHVTCLSVLLRRWEEPILKFAYLSFLHLLGTQAGGGRVVLVAAGFWVVGVSVWPIPELGPLRHPWILLGNAAALYTMESGAGQVILTLWFMFHLGARPNLLTLNVVSVVLAFVNAIPFCMLLAATVTSRVPPFLTVLLVAPTSTFPDQFAWSTPMERQERDAWFEAQAQRDVLERVAAALTDYVESQIPQKCATAKASLVSDATEEAAL